MMRNFSVIRGAMPCSACGCRSVPARREPVHPSPRKDGAAPHPPQQSSLKARSSRCCRALPSIGHFCTTRPPGAIGRVVVVDGDAQRVLGTIASGYLADAHHDHGPVAVRARRNLLFARLARLTLRLPDRTTTRQRWHRPARRHFLQADFSSASASPLRTTRNGRFLLSANATPATSVDIIDLASRRRLSEISTPGCTLILPHGAQDFSSSARTVHSSPCG